MSYEPHTWVSKEIIRATQLNHLEQGIVDEETRATGAEKDLHDLIDAEITRAGNAEDALNTAIGSVRQGLQAEIARAQGKETELNAKIDAMGGNSGAFIGTCSSAASASTKEVTCAEFAELFVGAIVAVTFANTNTYNATTGNPCKLNVNNTGAKNIFYNNTDNPIGANTTAFGYADRVIYYVYDGTNWVWAGSSYSGGGGGGGGDTPQVGTETIVENSSGTTITRTCPDRTETTVWDNDGMGYTKTIAYTGGDTYTQVATFSADGKTITIVTTQS